MDQLKKDVLVHKVYTELKKKILKGDLKPGEKLYQEKVARQLGVSRTPLIKALHILEQEMILVSIPRRGMYVRSSNIIDFLNAYECRQGIETTAVRVLTGKISEKEFHSLYSIFIPFLNSKKIDADLYLKADVEFHTKLIQMTKNNYLIRMYKMAHVFSNTYKEGLVRDPEETLPEHLMILSAIETRDSCLAEEYMRNHMRKSIDKLKRKIADMQ